MALIHTVIGLASICVIAVSAGDLNVSLTSAPEEVSKGSNFNLTCTYDLSSDPTIENATVLLNGKEFKVTSIETVSTAVTADCSQENTYSCKVSTSGKTDSSNLTISFTGQCPNADDKPAEVTVKPNDTTTAAAAVETTASDEKADVSPPNATTATPEEATEAQNAPGGGLTGTAIAFIIIIVVVVCFALIFVAYVIKERRKS
jgi:cobalamin biosynthesis Mg chelatase CobN